DETLTSIEDRDMWLRIAAQFECLQVFSPCWWYRPHPGQMSRRASRMMHNYATVLTKFFAEHPDQAAFEKLAWSYFYLDSAWTFFEEGDRRKAWLLTLKSAFSHPRSLRDEQRGRLLRTKLLARTILPSQFHG